MPKRPKPRYRYLRVGREKKYSLEEKTRKRLEGIIGQDCPAFLKEFEQLVSRYQLRYALERKAPKPSEIRAALEELHCTANKLYELLNEMDTSTRGVLYDNFYPKEKSTGDLIEDKDVFDYLITDLEPLIQATEEVLLPPEALLPSSQIHQRGRPPTLVLDSLASGLAVAFNKHLTVRPTKTRGGKFEQCLRIVLEATGAHETVDFPGDLFPIVSQAIDGIRNAPAKG